MADVVLRSCALPIYFPSYQGYIDGGVCGSINPTMCAVAQALDGRNEGGFRSQLSDLLVLSIGTGRVPKFIDGVDLDWGLAKWALYFVDLFSEAPVDIADFECKQVLGERYHRVQVSLSREVKPDDHGESPFLDEVARSREVAVLCEQAADWIEQTGFLGARS